MVSKEQHALHIPISTVAHCHEAVVAFRKGIADFIGLKVLLIYLFMFLDYFPSKQSLNFCMNNRHYPKLSDQDT
jgi:hypothetical protein